MRQGAVVKLGTVVKLETVKPTALCGIQVPDRQCGGLA